MRDYNPHLSNRSISGSPAPERGPCSGAACRPGQHRSQTSSYTTSLPVSTSDLVEAPAHKGQLHEHCQEGDGPHHHIHRLDGLELQEGMVRLHARATPQPIKCKEAYLRV